MSRTIKKHRFVYYTHIVKDMKRKANKCVRKYLEIPNGSSYKKLFETWDIRDVKVIDTKYTRRKLTRWQK